MLAIQTINTRALRASSHPDADPDTEWQTHYELIDVDYRSYDSVARAVALLELDADGQYQYRIVEVLSATDSYAELEAENLEALEALDAWVAKGCPRRGEELAAVERAAVQRAKGALVKVIRKGKAA